MWFALNISIWGNRQAKVHRLIPTFLFWSFTMAASLQPWVWVCYIIWRWGVYRCLYGLYKAGVTTPDWPTLKPSIVEPHQNTLVVLFLRPAGGWRWVGGRIKGSRVLLSRKFHYPIDPDLPPSQHCIVLYVSTFLSHWKPVFFLSFPLFLYWWQLQKSALSLAEGTTVLLQMEEKVWY